MQGKAPDHSYFGEFQERLGTERLMDIFLQAQNNLRGMELIREYLLFVDASQLINITTWDRPGSRGQTGIGIRKI